MLSMKNLNMTLAYQYGMINNMHLNKHALHGVAYPHIIMQKRLERKEKRNIVKGR